jgi:hypothetical protein
MTGSIKSAGKIGGESTMAAVSEKKMEANRRNAQKSTGPKSDEGKSRSRLNGLKHGMRASLLILPGENAEDFSERVDDWIDDLKPRNRVEHYLVDRAARVSWQLDRIERAYVARLTANINAASAGVTQTGGDDVLELGQRLFWDARGPIALYPHLPHDWLKPEPLVSFSGIIDDPNDPARLVRQLESTVAGCGWLMSRWAELRTLLEQRLAWQSPDKLKAIRLLGRQPLDVLDDPDVAIVFGACHKIDPRSGELLYEIWNELKPSISEIVKQRLARRPLDGFIPASQDEARTALLNVVDRAAHRLETLMDAHRKRAEVESSLMSNLHAFDTSVEGERIRRYETSCSRTLLRTLAEFTKMHKANDDMDPVAPANRNGVSPVTGIEVEPELELGSPVPDAFSIQSIDASASIAYNVVSQPAEPLDLGLPLFSEPETIHRGQELPSEPTVCTNQELPSEPTDSTNQELPSEPTDSTNQELPSEPTAFTSVASEAVECRSRPDLTAEPGENNQNPDFTIESAVPEEIVRRNTEGMSHGLSDPAIL